MKLRNMLIGISALVCTLLFGTALSIMPAAAQSSRPYVVFVNGWQNCCTWNRYTDGSPAPLMDKVVDALPSNAEIRYVPYSNFDNNGRSGNTSPDEQFLRDGSDFINNQLSANRPLILIGHSFGGDSILRLLPRIRRSIQFVAVIDPVSTGGFRTTLKGYTIPNNVGYFFNRWQNNEPFPNDFTANGSIPVCFAKKCDQSSQFALTDIDGKARTEKCGWLETCKTKQVRAGHQSLPTDDWIQRVIGDRIQEQLAAFSPPSPSVAQAQPSSLRLVLDSNTGSGNPYLYSAFDGNNPNHLWRVTPLSDGYFMITSRVNGAALDANGGNGNPYLNRNPDNQNPNHYWRLSQVRNYYMITSRVNGAALDANAGTGNLYLHPNPDTGNPNHLWKIIDIGSYKAIGSALKN